MALSKDTKELTKVHALTVAFAATSLIILLSITLIHVGLHVGLH